MPFDVLQKLPIYNIEEVILTDSLIHSITHLPNNTLKPNYRSVVEYYTNNANASKVFSFFYLSNNKKVRGYLVEPLINFNKALIFFNRSGTGDYGILHQKSLFSDFFGLQTLVSKGYCLVITQLQGCDGGEGRMDAGGNTDIDAINDLYNVFKLYENIDNSKIGMIGGSSGGRNVYQSARFFEWLKAGVIIASPTDEQKLFSERELEFKEYVSGFYDIQNQQNIVYRSPIKWANEIYDSIPLLLLHGTNDQNVDLHHSLDMANLLYSYQKRFRLKVFENGDHNLSNHQKEVINEITRWFDTYL